MHTNPNEYGENFSKNHCVKNVRIRSFSWTHFPTFGLNTDIYEVNLRVYSECRKIRTRKTPNTDTFYEVNMNAQLVQINAAAEELFKRKVEITQQSKDIKILHWIRLRAKDIGMKKYSSIGM